jgi:hypothetical protein
MYKNYKLCRISKEVFLKAWAVNTFGCLFRIFLLKYADILFAGECSSCHYCL